jgi:thymidine kinase
MSINLITGCMFSGKTSALINIAKMQKLLSKNVLIINFEGDTRYSENNKITTHDKICFDCFPCGNDISFIVPPTDDYKRADVICINEGQFFDKLVSFCVHATKDNKDVYVCGLDGDYLKRPFGEILNLIPQCETVCKLRALCMSCKNGTLASFTKKLNSSDSLIEIGSTEIYMPVCRLCYEN